MAEEMGHSDFERVRRNAEVEARDLKYLSEIHREVTLTDIYNVLEQNYGIERRWMEREIELEIDLAQPNPYIFEVYNIMKNMGKTIVFMSDMYLPLTVIKSIVEKCGYDKYDKIILSNEYKLRKGDGTLQQVLLESYQNQLIIHVGDNKESDVDKSIKVGLNAVHNPDSSLSYNDGDSNSLAGSFYCALMKHTFNGTYDMSTDIRYEHGFRVGGILTAGFCEYIDKRAKEKNIDRILFCARDCDVLYRVYTAYYNSVSATYAEVSRFALLNITAERNLYDLSGRYIIGYLEHYKASKTIGTILSENGFDYLIPYLEKYDIDKYLYPNQVDRRILERFIFQCKDIIIRYNKDSILAAKKYFGGLIGDAHRILIVDIGWTGSCVMALKYFIEKYMPEYDCSVFGMLMCTSRSKAVINSIQSGELDAYVYSPYHNMDLTRTFMPGGAAARNVTLQDRLHMPLEYLFTSKKPTVLRYELDQRGKPVIVYSENTPHNVNEIMLMQQGILDFVELWMNITGKYRALRPISAYVAINPLVNSLKHGRYIAAVYKNFMYDMMTPMYKKTLTSVTFANLLDPAIVRSVSEEGGKTELV